VSSCFLFALTSLGQQYLDAIVDVGDMEDIAVNEMDDINKCRLRAVEEGSRLGFERSDSTWHGCLRLAEKGVHKRGSEVHEEVRKSYSQAWHSSLGRSDALDHYCVWLESRGLRRTLSYGLCLGVAYDERKAYDKAEQRFKRVRFCWRSWD
jgi:hypothetical protein